MWLLTQTEVASGNTVAMMLICGDRDDFFILLAKLSLQLSSNSTQSQFTFFSTQFIYIHLMLIQ